VLPNVLSKFSGIQGCALSQRLCQTEPEERFPWRKEARWQRAAPAGLHPSVQRVKSCSLSWSLWLHPHRFPCAAVSCSGGVRSPCSLSALPVGLVCPLRSTCGKPRVLVRSAAVGSCL